MDLIREFASRNLITEENADWFWRSALSAAVSMIEFGYHAYQSQSGSSGTWPPSSLGDQGTTNLAQLNQPNANEARQWLQQDIEKIQELIGKFDEWTMPSDAEVHPITVGEFLDQACKDATLRVTASQRKILIRWRTLGTTGGVIDASSKQLLATDLPDKDGLLDKIEDATYPPSQFVMQNFSDETKRTLKDQDVPFEKKVTALVDGLNSIIGGREIASDPHFAGVALSEGTEALKALKPSSTSQLARFNRLVLEDAYPGYMRRAVLLSDFSELDGALNCVLKGYKRSQVSNP